MKKLLITLSFDTTEAMLLGAVLCVLFIFIWWWFSGRCPSCKKYRARKVKKTTLIDTSQKYEKKEIEDPIYNNNNEKIGHTKRTVQVLVTNKEYRNDCFCIYCNHTWSDTHTETDRRDLN